MNNDENLKEKNEKEEVLEESQYRNLTISQSDTEDFRRLDQYLASKLSEYSRTFLKKLFEEGLITGQGDLPLKLSQMPKASTQITLEIPPPLDSHIAAENIPLEILYEDEDLLFINKKAGMVTHPAPSNYTGTLVNALLYHCKDLKGIGNVKRPGIVHRLDKGTSGVMVVAKTMKSLEGLILLFSSHNLERKYEGLVIKNKSTEIARHGKIETFFARDSYDKLKMKSFSSSGEIGQRKLAITHYREIKDYGPFSHMEFKLETGRTHQIRVHSSQILKRPLLMDPLYGNPKQQLDFFKKEKYLPLYKILLENSSYPFLHAKSLKLVHPISKKELFFEAPPPQPFRLLLEEAFTLSLA